MFAFILNPLTLWISGAVVAAGVTGYVVVEKYFTPEKQPETVVEEKAPEAKKPAEVASLPQKQPEAAPEPIEYPLPKFDILRVEKDGYAVIAGSAPAGSKVEIFDGDLVIATENSGPSGQFVAVLDTPLSAGPHELIIHATLEDGHVLISLQAGIINVPDGVNDLMTMIIEPGKASKIMQAPEPEPKKQVEVASIEPQPKEEPVPVIETPKPAEKVEEPKPVEVEKVEEPKPVEKAEEPKPVETVEEPKPVEKAEEPKPVVKAEEPKPVEKVEEPKPVVEAEKPKPVEKVEEVKQVEPEPVKPEPKKSIIPVLIQAADVEGKQLFIAGTGQPGAMVHIYIDGKFLGNAAIGDQGSYLFEGNSGLEAGRHAVRADMTEKGSLTVLARAVVSLLHEPVVIKPVIVAKVEPKVEEPKAEEPKAEEPKAEEPKAEAPVAEEPKVQEPKPAVVEQKPEIVEPPKAPTEMAVVKEEPKTPEPPKAVEPPAKPVEQAPVKVVQEPVETPKVEMAAATPEMPKEIVTGSSVIIRKGDSLWLVSRRKYGAGIRYTTIFDANREQIRDPNLIFPGQVFDIPDSESTTE